MSDRATTGRDTNDRATIEEEPGARRATPGDEPADSSSGASPSEDTADPDDGRSETELERADRNFNELLQELRVAQTGVQILFAFLLTAAFSQRFNTFDQARDYFDTAYAVTVWCALISTGFLVAPVGFHRVLFRRQMKKEVVNAANALAMAGLFFLALAMGGSILLILDVAIGRTAGIVGGAIAVLWLLLWWFLLPYLRVRVEQRTSSDRR